MLRVKMAFCICITLVTRPKTKEDQTHLNRTMIRPKEMEIAQSQVKDE